MKILRKNILLIIIIISAFFLRTYGIDWDQGFHLHPDERAIVMYSIPLGLPSNINEFLSPQSPLNPHFFAYGSLPLYLLKATSILFSLLYKPIATYDYIDFIGRFMSSLFDIGTIIIIYFFGKKLFSKKVGLFASFLYSFSVFPIQASHFYAVDIPLTFFILATLYFLILFYETPTKTSALFVGILFGASLATKTSALVLILSIGISLVADFVLIFLKTPHRPKVWFPHFPKFVKSFLINSIIITTSTVLFFLIFEPYALLDFRNFYQQTIDQSRMTYDAFIFPYTLQYVNKIPYLYEIKNMFFWGQGPIISILSFLGIIYGTFFVIRKQKEKKWAHEFIVLIFFFSYFIVVGKFAVGWMRYMLPLYPIFCLFAALLLQRILEAFKAKSIYRKLFYLILIILILIWPLAFTNIYSMQNTRVSASFWINENIPLGSTIAIEHWDDSLPLFGQQNYNVITLPLYDPDTKYKWDNINIELSQADYIIIASNRLYTPLMKLTDCKNLPTGRCYAKTAEYYKKLFDGSLKFEKIKEFSSYPKIPFTDIKIDDQKADESFTVYDHPKIMIFKKLP